MPCAFESTKVDLYYEFAFGFSFFVGMKDVSSGSS